MIGRMSASSTEGFYSGGAARLRKHPSVDSHRKILVLSPIFVEKSMTFLVFFFASLPFSSTCSLTFSSSSSSYAALYNSGGTDRWVTLPPLPSLPPPTGFFSIILRGYHVRVLVAHNAEVYLRAGLESMAHTWRMIGIMLSGVPGGLLLPLGARVPDIDVAGIDAGVAAAVAAVKAAVAGGGAGEGAAQDALAGAGGGGGFDANAGREGTRGARVGGWYFRAVWFVVGKCGAVWVAARLMAWTL